MTMPLTLEIRLALVDLVRTQRIKLLLWIRSEPQGSNEHLSRWHVCRYEVQGEYVIPSVAALPKSAAELALMQMGSGQGAGPSVASPFEQADGRWRVQVCSPCDC